MAHSPTQEVAQQEASSSSHQQVDSTQQSRNVLIVDDDSLLLFILQEAFRFYAQGYGVVTAKNGDEAVKVLEERPVDLVLTDLNMPFMNGYELLCYMAENKPNVPVFIMTANGEPEELKKLQSSGVSHCISKPFSTLEVLRRILHEFGDTPESPAAASSL